MEIRQNVQKLVTGDLGVDMSATSSKSTTRTTSEFSTGMDGVTVRYHARNVGGTSV